MKSLRRIWALVRKEALQMRRDPSSVGIGIVLPLLFLVLFGFGMSMDIRNIRLCIVAPRLDDVGAQELIGRFKGDEYFTVEVTASPELGRDRLASRAADAMLCIPEQLDRTSWFGEGQFLVAVNATVAAIARAYEAAVEQVVQTYVAELKAEAGEADGAILVEPRIWFNPANMSQWFMMPGVIVVIMSLIGCLLTALQVAREYEQGTLESLFATPVRPIEFLLAKMINNYLLGMGGLVLSVVTSCCLFDVPLRGSVLWLFVGSSVFLCSQMALGLVISSAVKNQFMAALMALAVSFMPSTFLSGFLYEIGNMPVAIQWLSAILPARYYVEFLQTEFLVGDDPDILVRNLVPLTGFLLLFVWMAKGYNTKQMREGA